MALQVHQTLWPQLEADAGLRFVYEHIEMPVSAVLQRIERHGVLIDAAVLARRASELGERMMALEQEAHALAGQPFNLGCPKQIGEILFTKLGLPVTRRPPAARPAPTKRCWRSWPPTTRCRPRCWNTAACRS